MSRQYAVVDLFAGPGGLSEGFASVKRNDGAPAYSIELSVEKEASAHKTLTLRSVVHQLDPDKQKVYLNELNKGFRGEDWSRVFREEWENARRIALQLELGTDAAQCAVDERIADIKRRYDGDTVLIGGPPCQAYSLVGRARNLGNPNYRAADDGRHYLYREYIRILDLLRPAVFVMENVKGILSSRVDGTRIFPIILEELQRIGTDDVGGYEVVTLTGAGHKNLWGALDPRDFIVRAEERGIPQARHRVIVVGFRKDIARRLPREFEDHRLLPETFERATVESVLAGMPRLRGGLSSGGDSLERWKDLVRESLLMLQGIDDLADDELLRDELQKVAAGLSLEDLNFTRQEEVLRTEEEMPEYLSTWIRQPNLTVLPNNETRAHIPQDLRRYLFASAFAKAHGYSPKAREYPEAIAPHHRNWTSGKFNDRFRVQMWDKPSSTVTSHISKDGHYYIHPDPLQARSLTVREAARLQTFPDDYLFLGNRTEQYVQVGNAVPALLAFQIAMAIANLLV